MEIWESPSWLEKYRSGTTIGRAQAYQAYADYYGMGGGADYEPAIEERLGFNPQPMRAYASRTGTKRNLEAMRSAGWRLLVSATGVHRTEGFANFALDNGAWTAFQQGKPFDEVAFGKALDKIGEGADWVVVPDIVAGGMRSLEFSLKWLERLHAFPQTVLLAVQDGMEPDDVRPVLDDYPTAGIFLGGSTPWKLKTMEAWGILARRRNCYFHVGRVNSVRRIAMCAASSADSFDGTSASRFSNSLPPLDRALVYASNQQDFLAVANTQVSETPFDCRWPLQGLSPSIAF